MPKPKRSKSPEQDSDYDGAWKEALREHFREFLEKYFPAMCAAIDWTHPPQWSDKELSRILAREGRRPRSVDLLAKVRLLPGVIPSLIRLRDAGYRLVLVSNQDGLGTDSFPVEHFEACHEHVVALFESQGITFDETFICPHFDTRAQQRLDDALPDRVHHILVDQQTLGGTADARAARFGVQDHVE